MEQYQAPVAYPGLVSRGFPKLANLSGSVVKVDASIYQTPDFKKILAGGGFPGNHKTPLDTLLKPRYISQVHLAQNVATRPPHDISVRRVLMWRHLSSRHSNGGCVDATFRMKLPTLIHGLI